jgi:hypothetical protein
MGGNVKMALQELGEKLMPAFGGLLDKMKPLVDGLPSFFDKIAPLGERMIEGFGEVLPGMLDFGEGVGKMLKPIADFALSDPMKDFANNVLDAGSALAGLTGEALGVAGRVAGTGVSIANGAFGVAGDVFGRLAKLPGALGDLWDEWTGEKDKQKKAQAGLDYSTPGGGASQSQVLDMLSRGKITAKGFEEGALTPGLITAGLGTKKLPNSPEMKSVSDSIVGGGARKVEINIKNLVETINNTGITSTGQALQMNASQMKRMLVEILASLG